MLRIPNRAVHLEKRTAEEFWSSWLNQPVEHRGYHRWNNHLRTCQHGRGQCLERHRHTCESYRHHSRH